MGIVISFLAAQHANVECAAQTPDERTMFCEVGAPDGSGLRPVPIPKEVLDAVMRSEGGREARAFANSNETGLGLETFLKGTPLRLSNDGSSTFLIVGSKPLSGVDNTWFWIVRESAHKASVLLWTGANCMQLTNRSTNGYRDVKSVWSSSADTLTESYKYNGKAYRLARKTTIQNRRE